MEAVAVFMVGVGIVWIVFWAIRNDKSPRTADQRGLFRMRVPAEPEPEARRRPASAPRGAEPAGSASQGAPSRN